MILSKGIGYFIGRLFLSIAIAGTGITMILNLDNENSYRYSIIRFNHYVAHNTLDFLNEYYL